MEIQDYKDKYKLDDAGAKIAYEQAQENVSEKTIYGVGEYAVKSHTVAIADSRITELDSCDVLGLIKDFDEE